MNPTSRGAVAVPIHDASRELGRAGRVLIVSNRLPTTVQLDGDAVRLTSSSGGLATGLRGVHERSGGTWIGWSGLADLSPRTALRVDTRLAELSAASVPLSADEVAGFYARYSNETLWPVLHDRFDGAQSAADWNTYRAVNLRFATVVGRHLRPGDTVWVHDYHLMLVPRLLRALHPGARIGFFLHTPFPSLDALQRLPRPQRAALLDGLVGADVVAFHTPEYAERFANAARVELGRRDVQVRACPMGIDVASFEARAADARVAAEVARLRAPGGPLLVGVDRLDYTKGIPERVEAFARLLDARPDLRGHARLFQLAVPSREDVPAYRVLRERVERLVARVNARFGTQTWRPIEYVYRSVDPVALSALYRAADVMLVTPLRDGMNLVAKEFVASRTDDDGVLVLSRHAGAAAELRAALLVDPRDVDGLARAYDTALAMSPAERRVRMRRLRRTVRAHDVFRWADACVEDIAQAAPRQRFVRHDDHAHHDQEAPMNIETERPTPPDETGCPECGSTHVRFRVQHTGVSHRPLQERSLRWECRQCAAHWSERLFALPAGEIAAAPLLAAPPGP